MSILPTRCKPPTRFKLLLTRCKLLARTYKVHLVGDNLHLVACPRNHESLSSGPKAPIHRTHQLCQNVIRDWQNAYWHYKMHIVIDNMYLGTDKVQLAPTRVTKNAHCQRMHLGSVGFPNNLQFESQLANSKHLIENCHWQDASCKYALTRCTLSATVCTLLGDCTLSVTLMLLINILNFKSHILNH